MSEIEEKVDEMALEEEPEEAPVGEGAEGVADAGGDATAASKKKKKKKKKKKPAAEAAGNFWFFYFEIRFLCFVLCSINNKKVT